MTTYAIGDIQGCYRSLMDLLQTINFDEKVDTLWFTGDLVNRGPESLACLKFIESLGKAAITVLGNHDLHLLAVAHGASHPRPKDTIDSILQDNSAKQYLDWLQHQPLLHYDADLEFVMTHAGIPPHWSLDLAQSLALEVEEALRDPHTAMDFYRHMYGNEPAGWSETLQGTTRLRTITNYFTRMRLLDQRLDINFSFKRSLEQRPEGFEAWFNIERNKPLDANIVFGHWAALMGGGTPEGVYAVDTGCVWGNRLTALNLESREFLSVAAAE